MKKVTYFHLNGKEKENADWEIQQRNSVSKHMNKPIILTIFNSMFYTNGVYSNLISSKCD